MQLSVLFRSRIETRWKTTSGLCVSVDLTAHICDIGVRRDRSLAQVRSIVPVNAHAQRRGVNPWTASREVLRARVEIAALCVYIAALVEDGATRPQAARYPAQKLRNPVVRPSVARAVENQILAAPALPDGNGG